VILPDHLELSAYASDSGPVSGELSPSWKVWGSRGQMLTEQKPLAPTDPAADRDWSDPEVGWGVVLADDDTVPVADRAVAADAPEPVRRLLAARPGSPVLRYRAELGTDRLRRYYPDGSMEPPEVGVSVFGTGRGRLPRYLLIIGGPDRVPWRLQLALNRRHFVGRLDLSEEGLTRYVDALLTDWSGATADPTQAVVWSTSHDSMTQKMDVTVAAQVSSSLATDSELTVHRVTGGAATGDSLGATLSAHQPALLLTSSHGMTGPLGDATAMRAQLGLPVGQDRKPLDPTALLSAWDPYGAVWIAQACCSAGSNLGTSYDGLLSEGTLAYQVVHGVAGLGPQTSPLPRQLLGAERPLRAFVGHVEPTFDWTLFIPDTGQHVVTTMVRGIYPGLFQRRPLGLTLADYYAGVGSLYGKLSDAQRDVDNAVEGARDRATYYKLTALDRESLVVLGDPTVMVPPLPSQR
jgi:hypothetical protein